jgi:hypothetical protein
MVIIANKMQKAMDNDSIQLIGKLCTIEGSIFTDRIHTDKKISGKAVALTIVESNDVCIIIVLQIFYIDI